MKPKNLSLNFDQKIKSKFKLFKGIRPQKEDEKIYQKIYDALFDEIIKFLYENLNQEQKNKLIEKLESANENLRVKILLGYLKKTGTNLAKLSERLDNLLNSISLEN